MSDRSEIVIAGLRISAPETWKFYEFENLVLARRDSRGGSLQLSTAFRFDCTDTPTPQCCEACVRQWLGDTTVGVFEVRPVSTSEEWMGGASLGPGGLEGRAWYVLRDGQLLLGVYQWAPDQQRDSQCADEIEEAEAILRSSRWDREGAG